MTTTEVKLENLLGQLPRSQGLKFMDEVPKPTCPELIEARIDYGKDEALVWCKAGETGEKD